MISDLSLLSESTATPAPATEIPSAQAEVVVHSLNMRQGPGVEYPAVGVAYAGEVFAIVGKADN
jgi:uncharacterized protein YraI